ncbi:MalM family protein [Marinobacter salicampi]|uniref:MalM family protein n=1 Tax=Marinobacter salicampi TaxID=435907 RepID=UPI00140AEBE5|nr:MalM family protein [Marinobacter salicampi]
MTTRYFGPPLLAGLVILTGCQQGAPLLDREGYYTWVDASGQLQSTRVPREQNKNPEDKSEQSEEAKAADSTGTRGEARASKESPEPATTEASGSAATSAGDGTPRDEFNMENFPDGNALEAAGFVRPGDPMPYYTWQDAQGQIRASYYRPDMRSDVEKGLIREPVTLTPASVYQRPEDATKTPSPAQGQWARAEPDEPEAFAVLGIAPAGETLFDKWRRSCCDNLPVSDVVPWSSGREFQVDLAPEGGQYDFTSGGSSYRLVLLPAESSSDSFVMRLRSYATDGLFVPSLAFLDSNMTPLRLVTDMVTSFTPESWARQGYTEAFVPVFPQRGERWLLIFTRAEDLAGQTVFETRRGPQALTHRQHGLISITEIEP